jgi:hypothetical protein
MFHRGEHRPQLLLALLFLCALLLASPGAATRANPGAVTPPAPELLALPDGTRLDKSAALAAAPAPVTPSLACAAAAPVLVSPAQGTTSNDLENPRYVWQGVDGVDEYVFQLAANSAFDPPLTSEQEFRRAGQSRLTATSFYDLQPSQTYYWRVASVCPDGQIGAFSAPVAFQSGPGSAGQPCALPPPALLEPANGAQVSTLVPRIAWAVAPNTYEYYYQLSTKSDFATTVSVVTFLGLDPALDTKVVDVPTDNLTPDTLYYWRVASICADIDARGAFSTPFSFRSGPAGGAFLAPPAPQAPADGVTTGSIRVSFLHSGTAGAENYLIGLYRTLTSAQADRPSRSFSGLSTARAVVFNPQETWYWRVKTRNAYGWGEASPIRSFTTPKVNAVGQITPEAGGILSPTPGYLSVSFPPGAVSAPTSLSFNLLASPTQRLPNFRFANRAFTLTATANGQVVTSFAKPFTLSVTYDNDDLAAAGITDPAQLNLVFWSGSAWQQILPCAGCSLDTANRRITVTLDHLTEFALVAPAGEGRAFVYLPLMKR